MNDVQYRFHKDLEFLTSPTDRIATVRVPRHTPAKIVVDEKREKMHTFMLKERASVIAKEPFIIFASIFSFYALLLLHGINMLLYIMVMVGSKIMR